MATPLGHSLAGYAVAFRSRRRDYHLIGLCIVMANAPDLDFLPGLLLGSPALYHQGITHSIVFGCILSLLTATVYACGGRPFLRILYFCSCSYLSHLVLDFVGPDGRPPYGIPLFWPFSKEHFISPIQVFWGMHHASSSTASRWAWIQGIVSPYNVRAIIIEVIVIAPFVYFATLYSKKLYKRQES